MGLGGTMGKEEVDNTTINQPSGSGGEMTQRSTTSHKQNKTTIRLSRYDNYKRFTIDKTNNIILSTLIAVPKPWRNFLSWYII